MELHERYTILTLMSLLLASSAVAAPPEYDLRRADQGPAGRSWRAENERQDLRVLFADDRLSVEPAAAERGWTFELTLLRWGRSGDLRPATSADSPRVQTNRIEFSRGGIVEWYVNERAGLEQGFDLEQRPAGPEDADLLVELRMETDLHPRFSADGRSVELFSRRGLALTYSRLVVTDATGATLPARMEGFGRARERGIRLIVDDRAAVYPIVVDPVLSTISWSVYGPNDGSAFGYSVASAGDVNGDGYGDILVGSPNGENGQANEGMAFVYLGSPSGLATTPVWSTESDQTNALLGYSVSTAGDINADGYADIIVGCAFCNGGGTWRGQAFVYFGSPTGPSPMPDATLEGINDSDLFGLSVSTAGDFNADGYSDIIVGSPGWNGSRGRAYMYGGSASGLTFNMPQFDGQTTGESFGAAVAGGGDIDGDGYGDVAIGAPNQGATSNDGRVTLVRGAMAGISSIQSRAIPGGASGGRFGAALAFVGDTTGDGTSDLAVGAPNEPDVYLPYATTGKVYVFSFNLTSYWSTFAADPNGVEFGTSVAGAGDVNDDGRAEIVVGDDNFLSNRGRAYVFRYPAPGVPSNGRIWLPADIPEVDDLTGTGVAAADVNGDGRPDLIVGAVGADQNSGDDRGEVRVYHSGFPVGTISYPAEIVGTDLPLFYNRVTAIGDVNADGYEDVAVAVPDSDDVYVFHGGSSGFPAFWDWSASGQSGSDFGRAVAGAGDVNGDGYADLVVGAPHHDGTVTDEGRAYLYLGSATGLQPSPAWTYLAGQTASLFGGSVVGLGDVNGDSYADVAVGAPHWTNGEVFEGRVFVFHGSSAGLTAVVASVHESDQALAYLGGSVDSAGDVNGDGYSDMIVGAERYDVNGAGLIYWGGPGGVSPLPGWQGDLGIPVSAELTVAGAGDLNGDGFADVALASRHYSNPELDEGAVAVFHGGPFGPAATPDWFAEPDYAGVEQGAILRGVGDANGDGYTDLLIGYSGINETRLYWGSPIGLTLAYYQYAPGGTTADGADFNGDGFGDVVIDGNGSFGFHAFDGLDAPPDRRVRLRQTDDSGPIAPLGESMADTGFGFYAAPPAWLGYARVAIEVEVKPIGVPFDGSGTFVTPYRENTSAPVLELATELAPGTLYHWRTRHRYATSANPFFAYGPWMPSPDNGWTEPDFRTSGNAAASAVPDGDQVAGTPLTVSIDRSGSEPMIALDFGESCAGEATDYAVYIGTLGDFTSHVPHTCSTGGLTSFAYPPDPVHSSYYLVVPVNVAGQREGSYGVSSVDEMRAPSVAACYPTGEPATCNP